MKPARMFGNHLNIQAPIVDQRRNGRQGEAAKSANGGRICVGAHRVLAQVDHPKRANKRIPKCSVANAERV